MEIVKKWETLKKKYSGILLASNEEFHCFEGNKVVACMKSTIVAIVKKQYNIEWVTPDTKYVSRDKDKLYLLNNMRKYNNIYRQETYLKIVQELVKLFNCECVTLIQSGPDIEFLCCVYEEMKYDEDLQVPDELLKFNFNSPSEKLKEMNDIVIGKMNLCNKCAEVSKLRCSKCKNVKYCSTECQKADWKNHKKKCTLIVKDLNIGIEN